MELYESMKNRRSQYVLSGKSPISKERLEEILRDAVKYTPSAFHSQSSRAVLLLGKQHLNLWSIVMEVLRGKVPVDKFAPTEAKVKSFASGYGTILYFEDLDVVKNLQENVPAYADNFPVWSNQSAGMLQYAVWIALTSEGLGASIQHYNPLIDDEVKEKFEIPESWKLIGQMPFGIVTEEPAPLEYKDLLQRVLVKE